MNINTCYIVVYIFSLPIFASKSPLSTIEDTYVQQSCLQYYYQSLTRMKDLEFSGESE